MAKTRKKKKTGTADAIHIDINSHNAKDNANYRMMDDSKGAYNSPDRLLWEVDHYKTKIEQLQKELKTPKGKQHKSFILADIRIAKSWLKIKKTALKKVIDKM